MYGPIVSESTWHLLRDYHTHSTSEATQCLSGRNSILFTCAITRHSAVDALLMRTRGTRQTVGTKYNYRLPMTVLNSRSATL